MSPRQASHFLCLAKESNQRKATPLCASLRFATGNLRCSLFAGSAQTRCAQTARGPDPRKAPLLGAARGELNSNAPWRVLLWGGGWRELRVLAHAAHPHAHAHAHAHANARAHVQA